MNDYIRLKKDYFNLKKDKYYEVIWKLENSGNLIGIYLEGETGMFSFNDDAFEIIPYIEYRKIKLKNILNKLK